MEASLQSNKPATTQDALLGLVSITRNPEETGQFDKVFDEASQKLDQDKRRTEEEEEEEKKVKKKRVEIEVVGCDLAGITGAETVQKGKQGKTQTPGPSKDDLIQAEKKIEISEEAKKMKQLARQKAVAQEHKESSKADQNKTVKLREQNDPGKASKNKSILGAPSATKSLPTEGQAKGGTQVAPRQDSMVMPAKQNIPNVETRPVLVEELRPATTAVETIVRSGSQQAQQDLPRETSKDQSLPITPIQPNVPSTPIAASTQAMASLGKSISPMLEKIWDAVTTFRVRGENEMVVKVQPSNDTEMQLTIKYGAGGVEIEARMQQGDGRQLASGWNELQQQLSDRGVRLGELLSGNSEEEDLDSDARQYGRQNQSHYRPADIQLGDEQADWSALGIPTREQETTKSVKQSTDKVEEAYDGWQSWA